MANFKLKKYVFIVRLFDKKPYLTQTEIMDAMREAFPGEDAPSPHTFANYHKLFWKLSEILLEAIRNSFGSKQKTTIAFIKHHCITHFAAQSHPFSTTIRNQQQSKYDEIIP